MRVTALFSLSLAIFLGACASSRHEFARENPNARPVSAVARELAPGVTFRWPVNSPVLSEYFGWRKSGRRSQRLHEGVDLRANTGTPVFAAAPGEVIYAGRNNMRFYGKMVVVDHGPDRGGVGTGDQGNRWSTVYAHLSRFDVDVGDRVERGQMIGLSGATGRVSGPHLHFEIRRGADPVDPLLFMPAP